MLARFWRVVGEAKGDEDGDIALRSVTVKPNGAVPIARLTLWEKWPGDESIGSPVGVGQPMGAQ